MAATSCQKGNFVKFIAYMQVIGIILVVFGHSFHEYPDGHHGTSMLIYRMMFSFRMPTFMFVSGFLMAYTTFLNQKKHSLSVNVFVLTKVKRLLVPYFVLTLVTFYPRAAMNSMSDDAIEPSVNGLLKGFLYMDNMPIPLFWFIQASFLLLVFTYSFIYFSNRFGLNKNVSQAILIILFLILPLFEIRNVQFFSLGYAVKHGLFFCLGIAYAHLLKNIDARIRWQSPLLLALFMAVWASLFFLTEETPFYPLCQLAGICMVISLAHMLEYRQIRILDHLIGANYIIFLLSWYFNVLSQQVLAHVVSLPWYVHTICSLFFGIYVPYFFYRYLMSHQQSKMVRCLSFLLGQKINKY